MWLADPTDNQRAMFSVRSPVEIGAVQRKVGWYERGDKRAETSGTGR